MPPSVGMRFGRFELLSRLAVGGMGEVFRARDHDLQRDVAIKFLPERFAGDSLRLGRFAQEARAASSLNHPNIVTIHEIGETSGLPYIVMELVEGRTLRQLVQGPRLSPRRVLEIASQLAEGLAKAHSAGIVHRDLKPENVMVTDDGWVKILDFGLAKLRSDSDGEHAPWVDSGVATWPGTSPSPRTADGAVLGTVGYMSPEQARGHRVDFRSDQFALGAILYEMATGRQAFHRDSPPQTLTAIIEDEPEPLGDLNPDFPPPARWIVERCLEKDPPSRYASTVDLAHELNTVRERLAEVASSGSGRRTPPRPVSGSWRRTLRVAGTAVVVVALLWGGWELLRRPGPVFPGRAPVIAVMPLSNLTGDEHYDAAAAGIADVVVGSLSAIDDLQVLSRAATLGYADRKDDLPAVARDLDASYLLDGVLQRSQGELRVSLSLIHVPSNVVRWSASFDGAYPKLFDLQSRVAVEVAHALRLSLSPRGRTRIEARPTASPSAWDDYSMALALFDRRDRPGNLDRAVAHLERALEADPHFARAHALLGQVCWETYDENHEPAWADRARDEVQEALRLDPEDASVRLALARIYSGRGQTDQALEEVRRARTLDPNSDGPMRLLATILAEDGQAEAALEEAHRAVERRPHFASNYDTLGWVQFLAGRWNDAAAAYQRVTELEPDNPWAYQMLGAVRQYAGDLDGAAAAYTEAIRLAPDPRAWANLGFVHYARGAMADALEAYGEAVRLAPLSGTIRRSRGDTRARSGDEAGAREDWTAAVELSRAALEVNPRDVEQLGNVAICLAKLGEREAAVEAATATLDAGPESWVAHFAAAVTHAILGDVERSLALVERALALGASPSHIESDEDLAVLHERPEFRNLLERSVADRGKEEEDAS
jgi:serine/threonine protein kinase/tetratricopeptide (TPR) repeat protein